MFKHCLIGVQDPVNYRENPLLLSSARKQLQCNGLYMEARNKNKKRKKKQDRKKRRIEGPNKRTKTKTKKGKKGERLKK